MDNNTQDNNVEQFTHMVVALDTYANGVGTAYTIGTLEECRAYILQHDMQDTATVIPF